MSARILREIGESDAASAQLDAARATFAALGARTGLAELNQLTGERPPGTLTEREVEVLRLVSTGLTNRGVAGRLSLSEKTVARHLSNIFGKLGALVARGRDRLRVRERAGSEAAPTAGLHMPSLGASA